MMTEMVGRLHAALAAIPSRQRAARILRAQMYAWQESGLGETCSQAEARAFEEHFFYAMEHTV